MKHLDTKFIPPPHVDHISLQIWLQILTLRQLYSVSRELNPRKWTRRSSITDQTLHISLFARGLWPCRGLFWRAFFCCQFCLLKPRFFHLSLILITQCSAAHLDSIFHRSFSWFIKILFSFEIPSFIQSSSALSCRSPARAPKPVINLETFNANRHKRVKNNRALMIHGKKQTIFLFKNFFSREFTF